MEHERIKNTMRNLIWGTLNSIVSLLLPFITRTVLIYTMGIQFVGLGSLFTSILSVLSFAELGIGGALVFNMYKPIAEGDTASVRAWLNFYRKTYRVVGAVILCLGLLTMPFLRYLIKYDIPDGINIYALFAIYLLNNLEGYFLFAYKQAVFLASQRVDVLSKVETLMRVALHAFQILSLLAFRSYLLYTLSIPLNVCLNNLIVNALSNRIFPEYQCEGMISELEKRGMRKKVQGVMFQKIGSTVLFSVDTIVISSFLGLKTLGIYNNYYYVIVAVTSFFSVIQRGIIPSIGNRIVLDSKEENLKDFHKFHFLYIWLVTWCCCCLLCLFQPFVRVWQRGENMLPDAMIPLLTAYFFTFRMGDICFIYREALGMWWEARFVPLGAAALNLTVNLLSIRWLELYGIVLSTILSLVCVYTPFGSMVLFMQYFRSKEEYVRYLLKTCRYFTVMCLTAGTTYLLCRPLPGGGVALLLERAAVCCVAPNALLLAIHRNNPDFKAAGEFALYMLPQNRVRGVLSRLLGLGTD